LLGTSVQADSVNIGRNASGSTTIAGSTSILNVTNSITVGGDSTISGAGSGTLNIFNGAQASANDIYLAAGNSSTANRTAGALNVSASTLTVGDFLYVGFADTFSNASAHFSSGAVVTASVNVGSSSLSANSGSASLIVDSGAHLLDPTGWGALISTINGTAAFVADGAQTLVSGGYDVFTYGTGTASAVFRNGAHLDASQIAAFDFLSLGGATSSSGRAVLTFTDPGTLAQGLYPIFIYSGLFTVSNGAQIISTSGTGNDYSGAVIGYSSTSDAKTVVTGAGSLLNCSAGNMTIAFGIRPGSTSDLASSANVQILNGAAVQCLTAYVGRFNQATGAVLVSNPGSSWQIGGNLYVGGSEVMPTGSTGSVEVTSGATMSVAGTIKVWNAAGNFISLMGGTINAQALDFTGIPSGLIWTSGTLSLTGGGTITGIPHLAIPATGLLKTAGPLNLTSLVVNGQAQLLPNGAVVNTSIVQSVSIAGSPGAWTGKLDLSNSLLIVEAATGTKAGLLSQIQNQISTGKGTGGWAGNGITSSSALSDPTHKGVFAVDNALLGLTVFGGQPVDANSILVASTYYGDSNLDRKVDVTDLGVLATNYGKSVTAGILLGDFNGDGKVDVSDLGLLATDYGLGTQAGGFSVQGAPAPEPVSVVLLLSGVPMLVRSRRRSPKP
jgi:T5SS/PEP-CTERM-associated repeat protein